MTNSQMFKKAHSEAKETAQSVGDYQVAFTIALRRLQANKKLVLDTLFVKKIDSEAMACELCTITFAVVTALATIFAIVGQSLLPVAVGISLACLFSFIVWIGSIVIIDIANFIKVSYIRKQYPLVRIY